MGYSVVHIEDVPLEGRSGQVRFVRRALGVSAFGINWFELPPDTAGHEHDEADTQQEEVSIVIHGAGRWLVAVGELKQEVPVHVGSIVRFDPETVRAPVAGPDGLTFVSIGVKRGSYEARGNF